MTTKENIAIIDEIHEKVDTASEKALTEAKKILTQSVNNEKFERLKKVAELGFPNAKEVKEAKKELEDFQLATEKSKWINHYQTRYPYKYILVEDIQKICRDYKLIMGADCDYIDSIPEKNQKEIINFKLLPEDAIYYCGTVRKIKDSAAGGEGVIDWAEISEDAYNKETDNGRIKKSGSVNFTHNTEKHYCSNKDYFTICATPNMFDLKGKVIEGVDLKQKVEWDDPIVLKAVKYGYLICSVWGQELVINKVRNEREN